MYCISRFASVSPPPLLETVLGSKTLGWAYLGSRVALALIRLIYQSILVYAMSRLLVLLQAKSCLSHTSATPWPNLLFALARRRTTTAARWARRDLLI